MTIQFVVQTVVHPRVKRILLIMKPNNRCETAPGVQTCGHLSLRGDCSQGPKVEFSHHPVFSCLPFLSDVRCLNFFHTGIQLLSLIRSQRLSFTVCFLRPLRTRAPICNPDLPSSHTHRDYGARDVKKWGLPQSYL